MSFYNTNEIQHLYIKLTVLHLSMIFFEALVQVHCRLAWASFAIVGALFPTSIDASVAANDAVSPTFVRVLFKTM